ncbi:MAG: SDR family oxidoreductase [Chitinophagales bacterium]|nr:SDR family oxidoreductase [Chitinophagales bacterium]
MKNRNIIVTGGNAGIGLATSIALAKQGANVFIVCRSKEKAEAAVKEISKASGNTNIRYFLADLSSQKSIRALAADIRKELSVIDVLINNAGGVFPEFRLTEDGIESCIATNHFAYFLLTNLVLDLVKKSDYARIVNVSSNSHYRGKIDFESFTKDKGYFITSAYEQSKLANVLFTNELADRLSGTHVTVNSLHPGVVNTQIGNKGTQWYAALFWSLTAKLFGVTIEEGARTSVYLASSPEVKNVTGKYFDSCTERKASNNGLDKNLGKELWRVSEQMCPLA